MKICISPLIFFFLSYDNKVEREHHGYGKILTANIISRTGRNKKLVREDILQCVPFPVLEEIKCGMGSSTRRNKTTERNKNRVREDIEGEYAFQYWKK